MTRRPIPGWLKTTLELGPVALFFVAYLWLKDGTWTFRGTDYEGFIVVTALFIPVILASTALLYALTGRLSTMQIVTAVLVVVFGGLSVWLNDERFIKMKPTLIYGLFAAVLFVGLWRGRSWLAMVLGEAVPMTPEGWTVLTRRAAWFFVALAASNELVWRTMPTETWVTFETFGLPLAFFAFFMAQAGVFKAYAKPEADGD